MLEEQSQQPNQPSEITEIVKDSKQYHHQYYLDHREKWIARKEANRLRGEKWRKLHPEKSRENSREYQREQRRDPVRRAELRERSYKSIVKRTAENRAYIDQYKRTHGCVTCPETDPDCLDFDHRNPKTKKFRIAEYWHKTLDAVEKEITKCDVRCANCHRKKHARERRERLARQHKYRLPVPSLAAGAASGSQDKQDENSNQAVPAVRLPQ